MSIYDDDPDFSAAVTKRVIAVTLGERAARLGQQFDERYADLAEHEDIVAHAAREVVASRYGGDPHKILSDEDGFMKATASAARRRLADIRGEDGDLYDTQDASEGLDGGFNGPDHQVPKRLGRSQRENDRANFGPMSLEMMKIQRKMGIY